MIVILNYLWKKEGRNKEEHAYASHCDPCKLIKLHRYFDKASTLFYSKLIISREISVYVCPLFVQRVFVQSFSSNPIRLG